MRSLAACFPLTCHEFKEWTQLCAESLQLDVMEISVAKTAEKLVLDLKRMVVKSDQLLVT